MNYRIAKKSFMVLGLLVSVSLQGMDLDLTQDQIIDQTFTHIPELLSRIERASRGMPIADREFQRLSRLYSQLQLNLQYLDMPGRVHGISQDICVINHFGNSLLERITPATRSTTIIPQASLLACDLHAQEIDRHAQRLNALRINYETLYAHAQGEVQQYLVGSHALLRSAIEKARETIDFAAQHAESPVYITQIAPCLQIVEQHGQDLQRQIVVLTQQQRALEQRQSAPQPVPQAVHVTESDEEKECPVCFEAYNADTQRRVKYGPCGHFLCVQCRASWGVQKKGGCPMCRNNSISQSAYPGFERQPQLFHNTTLSRPLQQQPPQQQRPCAAAILPTTQSVEEQFKAQCERLSTLRNRYKKYYLDAQATQIAAQPNEQLAHLQETYEDFRRLVVASDDITSLQLAQTCVTPNMVRDLAAALVGIKAQGVKLKQEARAIIQAVEQSQRPAPVVVNTIAMATSVSSPMQQQETVPQQRHALTVSFGVESEQGPRATMEDTHAHFVSPDSRFEFFAVYDGHAGNEAAQVLAVGIENSLQPLHSVIFDLLARRNPVTEIEIAHILKEAVTTVDEALMPHVAASGSTAIIALIDKQTLTLYIINLGDSRAIVGNHQGALSLLARFVEGAFTVQCLATDDHKPDKDRGHIEAAGSAVFFGRLDGSLAVSRVFGDFSYKRNLAITNHMRNADIYMKKITPQDSFIVLGSDGLWDVATNDVVAQEVHARKAVGKDVHQTTHDIEHLALSSFQQRDNVTTIVVYLH